MEKIFSKTLPEAAAELGLDPQFMRICAQEDLEKTIKRFPFIICRRGRRQFSYKIHGRMYQNFKGGYLYGPRGMENHSESQATRRL